MPNPRMNMGYDGLTAGAIPVIFDATIPLPTLGLSGLSVSPAIGKVVSDINTGTYSDPAAAAVSDTLYRVNAGYGVVGGRVLGVIERVEQDGAGTVLIRGTFAVPADSGSPPIVGHNVAVNGAGSACDAGTGVGAIGNGNCICIDYVYDGNAAVYQHAQGTLSLPTTNQQGPGAGPKMVIINLL